MLLAYPPACLSRPHPVLSPVKPKRPVGDGLFPGSLSTVVVDRRPCPSNGHRHPSPYYSTPRASSGTREREREREFPLFLCQRRGRSRGQHVGSSNVFNRRVTKESYRSPRTAQRDTTGKPPSLKNHHPSAKKKHGVGPRSASFTTYP